MTLDEIRFNTIKELVEFGRAQREKGSPYTGGWFDYETEKRMLRDMIMLEKKICSRNDEITGTERWVKDV